MISDHHVAHEVGHLLAAHCILATCDTELPMAIVREDGYMSCGVRQDDGAPLGNTLHWADRASATIAVAGPLASVVYQVPRLRTSFELKTLAEGALKLDTHVSKPDVENAGRAEWFLPVLGFVATTAARMPRTAVDTLAAFIDANRSVEFHYRDLLDLCNGKAVELQARIDDQGRLAKVVGATRKYPGLFSDEWRATVERAVEQVKLRKAA